LSRLLRLFRLARLLRLFRLIRVAQTMKRINSTNMFNSSVLRLLFMVFWIAFAAHFIAAGWVVMVGNPHNLDNLTRYIRAFYWTITTLTTIGYGDITPVTNLQTIYVIIIEILGAGMYGFIIGNIANLIANIDIAKAQYKEKLEKINTFMKYRNLPAALQTRINEYYSYLWESRRGYDESSVLNDLPVSLQTQVSLYINKDIIAKVPIFKGATEAFIKEIILNLEPVVFTPGDTIVYKGDMGYDMFFISKGSVDVVSEDESVVYATLSGGQFFGEIALLFSSPRTATIKAREYCDMYRLKKDIFDDVLERYPRFEKQIKELADKRKAEIMHDQNDDSSSTGTSDSAKEVVVPDSITGIHAKQSGSGVELSWIISETDVPCHFEIIRKESDNRWKILDSTVVERHFTDQEPGVGVENIYKVRAVNVGGPGPWSSSIRVYLADAEE
jgi:voltage-gated potassium channel